MSQAGQTYGLFLNFKEEIDPMSGFEQFIQERIYLQNVSPRTVDWYRQTFKWLEKYPLTTEGLKELEQRSMMLKIRRVAGRARDTDLFADFLPPALRRKFENRLPGPTNSVPTNLYQEMPYSH